MWLVPFFFILGSGVLGALSDNEVASAIYYAVTAFATLTYKGD